MKVIGHRGAAALAPENTFAGFDIALRMGADGLETDVQMTKDGVLILFHDKTLERTSNGKGKLLEMTWNELKTLDIGSWFHPSYSNQRIPLLFEFLEKYGNKTSIDLEVKQEHIEKNVLDMVTKLGLLDSTTFTTFNFKTAKNIKRLLPKSKVGYLTSDLSDNIVQKVAEAGLSQFSPDASKITLDLVKKWKNNHNLFIRAYGVKNEQIMKNAISAQVDGMTIDFPQLLLQEMKRGNYIKEVLSALPHIIE